MAEMGENFSNVLWLIKNVLLSHRHTLSLQPAAIYPRVRSKFFLILFSTKLPKKLVTQFASEEYKLDTGEQVWERNLLSTVCIYQ